MKGKGKGESKASGEGADAGSKGVGAPKGVGKTTRANAKKPRAAKAGKKCSGPDSPKIHVSYSHEKSRSQFLGRATGESSVQFKYKASTKGNMAKAEAACKLWCKERCMELKIAVPTKFL